SVGGSRPAPADGGGLDRIYGPPAAVRRPYEDVPRRVVVPAEQVVFHGRADRRPDRATVQHRVAPPEQRGHAVPTEDGAKASEREEESEFPGEFTHERSPM